MTISGFILFLKVLGFILSLAFAVGIVWVFLSKKKLAEEVSFADKAHFHVHEPEEGPEQKRWQIVEAHFKSKNPAEWKMAIIDADTMLEDMIERMGYVGATFADKLKGINPTHFWGLDDAWRVHKLRNAIAHQGPHFRLSERDAYQAFKTYEQLFHNNAYFK